jgi:hypothetical protein
MDARVGSYAFVIGVVIALVLGLANVSEPTSTMLAGLLVVLGLIVGFLNVTGKETKDYLIVAAVLIITVKFGGDAFASIGSVGTYNLGEALKKLVDYIITFTVPAVLVVSVKSIWGIAKSR